MTEPAVMILVVDIAIPAIRMELKMVMSLSFSECMMVPNMLHVT